VVRLLTSTKLHLVSESRSGNHRKGTKGNEGKTPKTRNLEDEDKFILSARTEPVKKDGDDICPSGLL